MAIFFEGTQFIQGGLVKPYHGSQRAGEQVQLVLDHQVGREQSFYGKLAAVAGIAWPIESFFVIAADSAKECAYRSGPGQGGKLIHRGNDETRQPPVDR